ncbi:MAG: hypothetical protein Q7T03_08245, partial [Deltaproteobacteria bacterium]|nr:hypothetical protein [Deltaproteobacteria bacterium]
MKKGRNLKLHLLTVLFLTFAVLETPFALVNAPRFQQWFLKTYKPFSPWQVSFDSLEVKPWRMRIDISHLSFVHPGGHTIFAETIKMRGSPLQLLRGRIGINSLFVHSPVITIAKSLVPKEEKPKKKFKIQTLIFLQNLVLKEGRVENVILHLPEQKKITVEEVQINLQPAAFFKGTGLGLNFHQIESTKPEDPGIRKVENLQIAVTTNFNSWSKTFPYIDNIDGDFQLKNAALDRLEIKNMEAQLRFEKGNLNSKKFSVQIGENVLLGRLETDLHSEKFHLDLETPKPITLPELESETRTFNTAGDLTTKINLDGQGFDLQKSAGKGSAGIIHLFQGFEDHPATVILQFDWQNAKLNLKEGKIGSDGAMVEATGIVDLKPVSFHLKMKAKDFPIQRFFEKFEDKNLHPIFGKGTVEGTLEGIGKTIHLQLKGETIEGGYGPVKAERAAVNLDLTYPQLKLDGRIFTGERNTGEAQFIINYGPKFSEYVPRTKKISLDAKFNGQPMASTLPGLPITGEADATFKLSGSPPLNLQGEGTLNVRQGSFMDESFELIETHFNLNSKRLIVDKADFTFPNSKSSSKKQLVMDFTPGGIRISGQTLAGFDIDLTHTSIDDRWQINKLTVEDPSDPTLKAKVTGSISPESMDLKGDGKIDLSRLKFLTKYIRDASGPAQFQLAVHGKSPDLNINGQITFDNNMLFLRVYPYAADELTGVVRFKGNRIETDLLAGLLGNGIFKIRGGMTHAQGKVSGFDGKVEGQQLYYRSEDGKFRMEYDADLTFKGTLQNPSVTGTLNILDGAYTKDFN